MLHPSLGRRSPPVESSSSCRGGASRGPPSVRLVAGGRENGSQTAGGSLAGGLDPTQKIGPRDPRPRLGEESGRGCPCAPYDMTRYCFAGADRDRIDFHRGVRRDCGAPDAQEPADARLAQGAGGDAAGLVAHRQGGSRGFVERWISTHDAAPVIRVRLRSSDILRPLPKLRPGGLSTAGGTSGRDLVRPCCGAAVDHAAELRAGPRAGGRPPRSATAAPSALPVVGNRQPSPRRSFHQLIGQLPARSPPDGGPRRVTVAGRSVSTASSRRGGGRRVAGRS